MVVAYVAGILGVVSLGCIAADRRDICVGLWALLVGLLWFFQDAVKLYFQKSRRAAACGRAELLASFLGGAVWGVFRENANCGDPPGTLPGNLPGNLPVPSGYPVHFAGPNLENPAKIRQNLGKI